MAGLVATNYGEALFELAKEEKQLTAFFDELIQMKEVILSNEDLGLVLKHPKLAKEEKKQLLTSIFKDNNPYVMNFVKLLIDKSRFSHFQDIVKVFTKLYYKENNIEIAYVQSAVALEETQIQDIKQMLEKRYHTSIEMKTILNPSLLAGLRIKVKDDVLDNSAANRLARMKESVMKTTL